jgi:hypothetical protein
LGGILKIDSDSRGTTVLATFPCAPAAAACKGVA